MASARRRKTKTRKRLIGHLVIAVVFGLVGWSIGTVYPAKSDPLPTQSQNLPPTLTQETVMVVGGSMAHGWKDPNDNSYLRRAFTSLTGSTNTQYNYVDDTIIGNTAYSMSKKNPTKYSSWLESAQPQVVVISWGLLDDLYDKTTIANFKQAIHDEIAGALAANAVVMVITPPVVKGLLARDPSIVSQYIDAEFQTAASFHSPDVYTFDVYNQMKTYMTAHNQTIDLYYGDNWHPNTAGHELGGELLYNDILATFGQAPIHFIPPQHKGFPFS